MVGPSGVAILLVLLLSKYCLLGRDVRVLLVCFWSSSHCMHGCRGGSRNSLKGGGVRVQVRGNFHILTSK